jgi:histidine triad (HIT) family protein
MLKIALLQLTGRGLDAETLLHKGECACTIAKSHGAHLAIFPEMWNNGYAISDLDTRDPAAVAAFCATAVTESSPWVAQGGDEAVIIEITKHENMEECTFCKIVAGRAPASVVYRDDVCIAFMDITPVNPGHLLIVPLKHATYLADLDLQTGGALFKVAQRLSAAVRKSGLRVEGVNLLLADGEAAGQSVFHVHLHVLPRFLGDGFGHRFPATYGQHPRREQLDSNASAIRLAIEAA